MRNFFWQLGHSVACRHHSYTRDGCGEFWVCISRFTLRHYVVDAHYRTDDASAWHRVPVDRLEEALAAAPGGPLAIMAVIRRAAA